MRRLSVLVAILIVQCCAAARAADPWIGQVVFLKNRAHPKVGDQPVDPSQIAFPATVEMVKGNWLWLGRAWVPKDDVLTCRQALEYYSEEVRRNPGAESAWIKRGKAWTQLGEHDKAIRDFTEALRLAPDDALVYDSRGNAWAAAATSSGQSRTTARRSGSTRKTRSRSTIAVRPTTSAASTMSRWATLPIRSPWIPHSATVYYNRGLALAAQQMYDEAIADYTTAMELDPQLAGAYYDRGNAWVHKDQADNAIKDFAEALRRNPRLAKAYVGRALLWHQKHEYENAIKDFSEALRLEPLSAATYNHRGASFSKRGDYENALKDFAEAVRLDPQLAGAYNNAAWIHATCPDPRFRNGKAAVAEASKAVELSGNKWQCLATLAAAYADRGDFKKAQKVQEKVVELAPTDREKRELDARLDRYRAKKPYRDTVRR